MSRWLLTAVISSAALLLAACSSLPTDNRPQEFLDDGTAATVTIVDKPLVFARDRTERAANLRDYVTMVAASVNRSGKIQYVWITYAWSTLDPVSSGEVKSEQLVITADDRRIKLVPLAATASEAGVSVPVRAPPGVESISRVYATDLGTLRSVSTARDVRVQTETEDVAPYYELWDDQRSSLAKFVSYADGR
jgi:hypothetical protein